MDADIYKFDIVQPPPQYQSPFLSYEAASFYPYPDPVSLPQPVFLEPEPESFKVTISGLDGEQPIAVFHKQAKRILI